MALLNARNVLREPLVIVFDDWHVIDDEHAAVFRQNFVGERAWVYDIPMERLRFDLRGTVALFQTDGEHRELRREELERLLHRTEGWVTGLKLLSLAPHVGERTTEPLRSRVGGDGGRLEQFLLEEVFGALDGATRRFLMRVAVLQRMNGPPTTWT